MKRISIIRKVLTDGQLFRQVVKLLKLIIRDFFVPQFQTVFNRKVRHVVRVDQELDSSVPFVESSISDYLSFTPHWISALSWAIEEFGASADEDVAGFIRDLGVLHGKAVVIYKEIQSTTKRPRVAFDPRYWLLYCADPHVHCVPSLHVSEMGLTYIRMKDIIGKHGEKNGKYLTVLDEFFRKEVRIIESILYTKQHSLNCVSSGLFFLSAVYPEFTPDSAEQFIQAMFREDNNRIKNPEQLRSYIRNLYFHFMEEKVRGHDSRSILIGFLKAFPRVSGILWEKKLPAYPNCRV